MRELSEHEIIQVEHAENISIYEINQTIDEFVRDTILQGIDIISINQICQNTGIKLTQVLERLNKLVLDDILELHYEIRCDNCKALFESVKDYTQSLHTEVECKMCEKESPINLENIHPVYIINKDYAAYIRKDEV